MAGKHGRCPAGCQPVKGSLRPSRLLEPGAADTSTFDKVITSEADSDGGMLQKAFQQPERSQSSQIRAFLTGICCSCSFSAPPRIKTKNSTILSLENLNLFVYLGRTGFWVLES